MSFQRIQEKLKILADAAKYDVSCSSSGSDRKTPPKPWATHREWAFAIPIPKMGEVFPY